MLSFLKTKKSAGVAVTSDVHRLISGGNDARDRGEWDEAVENYRAAVTEDPSLVHIWIQLGHAEKERCRLGDAEAAYARAAMLQPDKAEPLLHLGHVYKLLGNIPAATRSYLRAARLSPADAHAIEELQHFIARTAPFARPDMIALLRDAIFDEKDDRGLLDRVQAAGSHALLIDVSSLLAAALAGRRFADLGLTGDLVAPAIIKDSGRSTLMCAHVVGHSRWVEVTPAQLGRIAALGRSGRPMGPIQREDTITDLDLGFLLSPSLEMPNGALLIDMDADHAPADHALFVREAQSSSGVRYVAFGKAIPAELAACADLVKVVDQRELTPEAVLQAVAEPIHSAENSPSPKARIARFEQLGHDGTRGRFRTGTGWLPPEDWGCWAVMPGGDLEIALPDLKAPRLYLRLKALPAELTRYQIAMHDGRQVAGEIEPGLHKWVVIDDVPVSDGVLRLRIRGENSALVNMQGAARKLPAMVGVVGFYICERNDHKARADLLESTTLGDLESLY